MNEKKIITKEIVTFYRKQGLTGTAIANTLNQQGYTTQSGGRIKPEYVYALSWRAAHPKRHAASQKKAQAAYESRRKQSVSTNLEFVQQVLANSKLSANTKMTVLKELI